MKMLLLKLFIFEADPTARGLLTEINMKKKKKTDVLLKQLVKCLTMP